VGCGQGGGVLLLLMPSGEQPVAVGEQVAGTTQFSVGALSKEQQLLLKGEVERGGSRRFFFKNNTFAKKNSSKF
jgi:hypothetical protein